MASLLAACVTLDQFLHFINFFLFSSVKRWRSCLAPWLAYRNWCPLFPSKRSRSRTTAIERTRGMLSVFFCLGKGSLMKNFLKLLLDHKVSLKIYQRIHTELPSFGFPRWFSDKRTLPPVQESQEMGVQPLSWEDHLEWKVATHSSILSWKIPRTEEPGGLQSMGSQRVGRN